MTRVTATEGRSRLFKLLDAVERGEEVILERGGVRFRLLLEGKQPPAESPASPLAIEDADLLEGQWTWSAEEDGQLVFRAKRQ